jgi:sugar/nucleoside kinase (ribokinase family)
MERREGPVALVVGALSRDLENQDGRLVEHAGGVVHYAGTALARLGAVVRIVTRVRPDDEALLESLRSEGVEVRALASRRTTTYRNDYTGPVDRHLLLETSDPICADDVPPQWYRADLVQLGPLHREDLDPEIGARTGGIVGIDVQGLVRVAGTDRLAACPGIGDFVAHAGIVQASESELEAVLDGESTEDFIRQHALAEMLVTRGPRGVLLIAQGEPVEIPAVPIAGTRPVGAGDVFLASYLFCRAEGRAPRDAAARALRVCATYIERGEVPKGFRP